MRGWGVPFGRPASPVREFMNASGAQVTKVT